MLYIRKSRLIIMWTPALKQSGGGHIHLFPDGKWIMHSERIYCMTQVRYGI